MIAKERGYKGTKRFRKQTEADESITMEDKRAISNNTDTLLKR